MASQNELVRPPDNLYKTTMLKPVARTNLSDQVFDQLRDKILAGEYEPGQRLPSERLLCESLEVNRSSVREALKRLEHVRLISTRQGGGSRVLVSEPPYQLIEIVPGKKHVAGELNVLRAH